MEELFRRVNLQVLIRYIDRVILVLVILTLTNIFIQYFKKISARFLKKNRVTPALITFISDFIRFIVWVISFAMILSILGFSQIALIIGGFFTVVSLILAKSISNVVEDLLAGVFLILDEDFQVGYTMVIQKIQGEIESLGIRKTKIKDSHGNLHMIPNKRIDSEVIVITKKTPPLSKRK